MVLSASSQVCKCWSALELQTPDTLHHFLVILAGARLPERYSPSAHPAMYAQRSCYGSTNAIPPQLFIHPLAGRMRKLTYLFDWINLKGRVSGLPANACGGQYHAGEPLQQIRTGVSFSILVSTVVSILTIPLIIGLSFDKVIQEVTQMIKIARIVNQLFDVPLAEILSTLSMVTILTLSWSQARYTPTTVV